MAIFIFFTSNQFVILWHIFSLYLLRTIKYKKIDTIAEFSDNVGLTCKLTKDRFYVSSLGNEETFALRGVNGIGIYDDLEKYNSELTLFKSQDEKIKNVKKGGEVMGYILYFFAICLIIMGFIFYKNSKTLTYLFLFIGILGAFGAYREQNLPINK
jgi:hypothetical protein